MRPAAREVVLHAQASCSHRLEPPRRRRCLILHTRRAALTAADVHNGTAWTRLDRLSCGYALRLLRPTGYRANSQPGRPGMSHPCHRVLDRAPGVRERPATCTREQRASVPIGWENQGSSVTYDDGQDGMTAPTGRASQACSRAGRRDPRSRTRGRPQASAASIPSRPRGRSPRDRRRTPPA